MSFTFTYYMNKEMTTQKEVMKEIYDAAIPRGEEYYRDLRTELGTEGSRGGANLGPPPLDNWVFNPATGDVIPLDYGSGGDMPMGY